VDDLGDPQPGGISGHENHALLEGGNGGEETLHFVKAEHHGQPSFGSRTTNVLDDLRGLEHPAVQIPQCSQGLLIRGPGQFLFVHEVQQIPPHLFSAEQFRALTKVAGKPSDDFDIEADRLAREVAHLHVFDHPLAQGGHHRLLSERGIEGVERPYPPRP
jgi:hypothetical protein